MTGETKLTLDFADLKGMHIFSLEFFLWQQLRFKNLIQKPR